MRGFPAVVLTAALAVGASLRPAAEDNHFPHTKSFGRATVQYQDGRVKAVIAYDYSQRNHDSPWLLVQAGVAVTERLVLHRDNLHLVGPDGTTIPVASQEQFLADSARIRSVRQNASIFQRQLRSYFPLSARDDSIHFFALPGDGIISDEAVILESHAVAIGNLYFKSPTGSWAPGTYRLVLNHERAKAELPVRLD